MKHLRQINVVTLPGVLRKLMEGTIEFNKFIFGTQ
jgi:hypothetical protein